MAQRDRANHDQGAPAPADPTTSPSTAEHGRRHGWDARQQLDKGPSEGDGGNDDAEAWEGYDWDYSSFCDCEEGDCRSCNTQATWWAQLNPHMPFEEDGIVHETEGGTYESRCGSTFLARRFDSYEQAQVFAAIAREQHKAITCFECIYMRMYG